MALTTKLSRLTLAASAAVLAALLWAPVAQAIAIGNGGGSSVSSSYGLYAPENGGVYFFAVSTPNDLNQDLLPIDVSYNPTAGPWEKTFNFDTYTDTPAVTEGNNAILLLEDLRVDGETPWTDWHEQILTPGWEWFDPQSTSLPPMGIYSVADNFSLLPGLTFNLTAAKLDFFFDPLQPGSEIYIVKYLQWVGVDANNPAETTLDPFVIRQYPTVVPEPSTFVLLGAGLAGLAAMGIRRRKH